MISEKMSRVEASRLNGAKSKGPVTEEGKEKSSRNAYKHGLFSSVVNLARQEDPENFKKLHEAIYQDYCPKNQMELHLVETIVSCVWKLRRADEIETSLLNHCDDDLGGRFERERDNIVALERIREKLEKRLKNSRKELEEMMKENPIPMSNWEMEFARNHTPEICKSKVAELIDQRLEAVELLKQKEEQERLEWDRKRAEINEAIEEDERNGYDTTAFQQEFMKEFAKQKLDRFL
jgi:hypothetical protein